MTPYAAVYSSANPLNAQEFGTVPDTLGFRKRIGLVVPSTNTTVQPETDALRVPGVTCHTGRVTIKERPLNTEEAFNEHMQMMRDGMGTAIDQIMTAGLDHLIMGIALETFWGGVAAADKLQADLDAARRCRRHHGVDRDGCRAEEVRRPQDRDPDPASAARRRDGEGLFSSRPASTWSGSRGLKCQTPRMIAQVPQQDIRNALRELDGPDVEALLAVGTALPSSAVAAEAERWLNKPVIAVNTVSFWDALRRCGIEDRVHGHGRVLEEL